LWSNGLWTVPLAFTALGSNYWRVVRQSIFAAASWSILNWLQGRGISSKGRHDLFVRPVVSSHCRTLIASKLINAAR
jgi:hypothetical protein